MGQSQGISDSRFFSSINPTSVNVNGLNNFCICLRIRREIHKYKVTLHMLHSAESQLRARLHTAQHGVDTLLCSVARSKRENFWLEFHTELHSAESQILFFF
jgi:hypothetical protein